MTGEMKFITGRNGTEFSAIIEVESDGALTVLSPDTIGYRSAHRGFAQQHFSGHVLWCMNRLSWINDKGVRVVLTRWHTQTYRTAK